MHTEGNDMGRAASDSSTPGNQNDPNNPGYETTDVNVGGVVVFLGGLAGFLAVFFLVCYGLGIVINGIWVKQDGPADKWKVAAGAVPPTGKGKNLTSSAVMEQTQLQHMTATYPTPRLQTDDGNQDTADMHAREDLLLDHYTTVDGQPGTIRIPIDRAMELIAQRGLPTESTGGAATQVADAAAPVVQVPLTQGFARTGYELTVMQTRAQQMDYGKAEANTHAELTPVR